MIESEATLEPLDRSADNYYEPELRRLRKIRAILDQSQSNSLSSWCLNRTS